MRYSIERGPFGNNAWFAGRMVLFQFTDTLQLGGETFQQTARCGGARNAPGFNLGGSYNLSAAYPLLFSAGQGLVNV